MRICCELVGASNHLSFSFKKLQGHSGRTKVLYAYALNSECFVLHAIHLATLITGGFFVLFFLS